MLPLLPRFEPLIPLPPLCAKTLGIFIVSPMQNAKANDASKLFACIVFVVVLVVKKEEENKNQEQNIKSQKTPKAKNQV